MKSLEVKMRNGSVVYKIACQPVHRLFLLRPAAACLELEVEKRAGTKRENLEKGRGILVTINPTFNTKVRNFT